MSRKKLFRKVKYTLKAD